MMYRAMFNTAFIKSNMLMLTRDEIDLYWDAKDQFAKDFRAELLFSEMDATASMLPVDLSCFEEEGIPMEAFAKVQEMFSSVDWLVPTSDAALNRLHKMALSDIVHEMLETSLQQTTEASNLLQTLPKRNNENKLRRYGTEAVRHKPEGQIVGPRSISLPRQLPSTEASLRGSIPPHPCVVPYYNQIEHRRAYNREIMLSKVKTPLAELMDYVLALDDSAMDVDQVDNLIKFCPTKEEMELIKGYKGELDKLGKCEQFFLELMRVPRSEAKLRVFSYKLQFGTQVSDLRKDLFDVYLSVEQIRTSVKLRRVMQTILSLGNALNQGTARGAAVGFRLDSLLKLNETRARNNKMTLMHYLCKVLADKLPELLDFSKELSSLEPASKIRLQILAEEMQAITKGLEKVVHEKKLCKKDGHVSKRFRKSLKKFLATAEGEVKALASLYSGVGKNVDALILYFGEDPARCPYEQVVSTLLLFVRMFNQAHEENCKQIEMEKKKAQKEAEQEKKEAENERLRQQKEAEKEKREAEKEKREAEKEKKGAAKGKKEAAKGKKEAASRVFCSVFWSLIPCGWWWQRWLDSSPYGDL